MNDSGYLFEIPREQMIDTRGPPCQENLGQINYFYTCSGTFTFLQKSDAHIVSTFFLTNVTHVERENLILLCDELKITSHRIAELFISEKMFSVL